MFDTKTASVELPAGEADNTSGWNDDPFDDRVFRLRADALSTGWVEPERHVLPDDLEDIPAGFFLAGVVSSVDPSRLNGHDAVRLMQAEARLSASHEAAKYQAMAEVAFCRPGTTTLRSIVPPLRSTTQLWRLLRR